MKYDFFLSRIFFLIVICCSCKQYVTNPSDSIIVRDGNNPGHDIFITDFSPDYQGMNNGIHSINIDGSGWAFLYRTVGMYSSPRGSSMVLVSDSSIYLADISGTTLQKILTPKDQLLYAILSPDGKKILYTTWGLVDSMNVYDIVSHTSIALITPKWDQITMDIPVFSDDSRSVLLTLNIADSSNLFLVSADGKSQTLIARDPFHNTYTHNIGVFGQMFDFSPDGSKFAYITKNDLLCIKDITSGTVEVIADSSYGGTWSPSGNFILMGKYFVNYNDSIGIYNVHSKKIRYFPSKDSASGASFSAYFWSKDEQFLIGILSWNPFKNKVAKISKMNIATGIIEQMHDLASYLGFYQAKGLGDH